MKDYPLLTVFVVACTCMMSVLILGEAVAKIKPKAPTIRKVPCSVSIQNIAKKINVTVLDECEVVE